MYEFDLKSTIKECVAEAINEPVYGGKSIMEWVAIGMKASRWISVKDRLPKNNSHVIVYDEDSKMVWPSCYISGTFFEEDSSPYFGYRVNWWRPLPEPPEEMTRDENC